MAGGSGRIQRALPLVPESVAPERFPGRPSSVQDCGSSTVEVNATCAVDETMRRTLNARFREYGLEDLSATGVLIIARKD